MRSTQTPIKAAGLLRISEEELGDVLAGPIVLGRQILAITRRGLFARVSPAGRIWELAQTVFIGLVWLCVLLVSLFSSASPLWIALVLAVGAGGWAIAAATLQYTRYRPLLMIDQGRLFVQGRDAGPADSITFDSRGQLFCDVVVREGSAGRPISVVASNSRARMRALAALLNYHLATCDSDAAWPPPPERQPSPR